MKKHSAAARYLSVFLTFVMLLSSPGALLVESDMLYEEEYIQTEEASEVAAGGSAQGSYAGSSDARETYEEPAEDVETGYEVAGSNTGDPSPYVENAQQTGSENGSDTNSGSGTGVSGSTDVSQAGSSSAGTDGTQTAGTSTTSPVVTWRSLTIEAKPAVLYEGSNQVTDDFLKAQAIWPFLYNRDFSYELSEQVRNTDGTLIQPGGEVTYALIS